MEGDSKTLPSALYSNGATPTGRPGWMLVNTYDLKARPKWGMESLFAHEGVPGHHLQISLAEERSDLPEWRKWDIYAVFSEGWGLYAETLGGELGLYKDPYSKFGQLNNEMWRAIRLVVDTGLHARGWSRQQAIDYCRANSAKTEREIENEVDRYIVQPGSVPAYKIGELKIRELRRYAEKELGPKFDVRAFHDFILGSGSLPLDVLEARVKGWVAEVR
jgi:prolyl oligopeptidase